MAPELLWLQSGIVTLAIIVGIVLNARRLERLRKHMDAQYDAFRAEMRAGTIELQRRTFIESK